MPLHKPNLYREPTTILMIIGGLVPYWLVSYTTILLWQEPMNAGQLGPTQIYRFRSGSDRKFGSHAFKTIYIGGPYVDLHLLRKVLGGIVCKEERGNATRDVDALGTSSLGLSVTPLSENGFRWWSNDIAVRDVRKNVERRPAARSHHSERQSDPEHRNDACFAALVL